VIVILARQADESARSLAQRWNPYGASILSPEDLSLSGWQYDPIALEAKTAVIEGRSVRVREITGVLTRLPWVFQDDLMYVTPRDRAYIASEMNAFLFSFLDGLTCPLLNRPTATCLSGPAWRKERWVHFAAGLGIPVVSVLRDTGRDAGVSSPDSQHPVNTVTVVGNHCFGSGDGILVDHAQRIAAAAGADMLAVHFRGMGTESNLVGADIWPDISSPEVADAIFDYLGGNC
jgi:hypothetical protein